MDTFIPPVRPLYKEISEEIEASYITAPFGDGYNMQVPKGINHIREIYSLSFIVNDAQYGQLKHFYRSHLAASFRYKVDGQTKEQIYRCEEQSWAVENLNPSMRKVTFKIKQSFI